MNELCKKLYEECLRYCQNINTEDIQDLIKLKNNGNVGYDDLCFIDGLLKKIFPVEVIPISFLNTEIFRTIIEIKYNISNDVFLVGDIQRMIGKSKQYILQEAKIGRLKGEKRDGTWIFRYADVKEYFNKKGIVIYGEPKENFIMDDDTQEEYKFNK